VSIDSSRPGAVIELFEDEHRRDCRIDGAFVRLATCGWRMLAVFAEHWPLDVPSLAMVKALGIRQKELPKFSDYAREAVAPFGVRIHYSRLKGYSTSGIRDVDFYVDERMDADETATELTRGSGQVASMLHLDDLRREHKNGYQDSSKPKNGR
jgi:hypothetical protein